MYFFTFPFSGQVYSLAILLADIYKEFELQAGELEELERTGGENKKKETCSRCQLKCQADC